MTHDAYRTTQTSGYVCLILTIHKSFHPVLCLEGEHSGNAVNCQRHRNHVIHIVGAVHIAEGDVGTKIFRWCRTDARSVFNPKFRSMLLSECSHIPSIGCIMLISSPIHLQVADPGIREGS